MADEEQEEVYSIEKIVAKKITKEGKVKYFLKWKDYPETDNTWEMAEDLDCDDLIQKFEEELSKNGDKVEEETEDDVDEELAEDADSDLKDTGDPFSEETVTGGDDPFSGEVGAGGGVSSPSPLDEPMREESAISSSPSSPVPTQIKRTSSGFEKGYSVETIIGITPRKTDKYAFLIKWKESTEPTLEEREVCNRKCPQKIIRFYEKRLVWMK